jgi:hypothetical protein
LVDGGVENFNTAVDEFVNKGQIQGVLTQTKILEFDN